MTIRLLLVDDDALMRETIRMLLSEQFDIVVVGEADNGVMALELARSVTPDVVSMDFEMPGMNGVEATRLIRAEHRRVGVVALSSRADEQSKRQMRDAGAACYVEKLNAHAEFASGVRAAYLNR